MSKIITLNSSSEQLMFLSSRDKGLSKLFQMIGELSYKPYDDPYSFLVGTIIGQMLSNKVAEVLSTRLDSLCNGCITPDAVSALSQSELRNIGLSKSKSDSILLLTQEVIRKNISLDDLSRLTDNEIIQTLTSLKGIGPWTAKMYLIFVLDRPDVLPYEDGAFLQSYSWLNNTKDLSAKEIINKCSSWSPYRSIAARYLYQALDRGLTKSPFFI